jgi:DNA polymerase III subunit delta'
MQNHLTILPPWFVTRLAAIVELGERVPHALLIHGQSGVGKRVFARFLARGLLCESADGDRRAAGGCGVCAACVWFDQGNHPDFRRITTEAIAVAEGIDDEALNGEAEDFEESGPRSKKAPSKEIKVEQIRALQRFLAVATHRNRSRVVLLHPLEAVKDVGANALLKMLEEPPPATVFILVADTIGRVPATILSRCRKIAVSTPSVIESTAWLRGFGVDDPAAVLALSGGAPFAALELAGSGDALSLHRELTDYLSAPGIERAMATAESFARVAPGPLIHGMQLWLSDCISMRLADRIRYHPAQSRVIGRLAEAAGIDALLGMMQRLTAIRRTVDHPLNPRLMLEGLLVAYAETMGPVRP